MKPLNIFIGVLSLLITSNMYKGLTNGFATDRQALIAGGLVTVGLVLLIVMLVKAKSKSATKP